MYEDLITAIRAAIKPNGREEITGQVLQNALVAAIRALGDGFNFAGVKTVENDDAEYIPENPCFYIVAPGLYAAYMPEPGETEPYHDVRNIEEGTFEVWTFDGTAWGYYPVGLGSDFLFARPGTTTLDELLDAWDEGKIILSDMGQSTYLSKGLFYGYKVDNSRFRFISVALDAQDKIAFMKRDVTSSGWGSFDSTRILSGVEIQSLINDAVANYLSLAGGTITGNVVAEGQFDFNGYTYFRQIADFIKAVVFRDAVQLFGSTYAKGVFEIGVDDSNAQGDLPVYNRTVKVIDKTSERKPAIKLVRGDEGDGYPDAQIMADNTGIRLQREVSGVMTTLVTLNSTRFEYMDNNVVVYIEGTQRPGSPRSGTEFFDTNERALYKYMAGAWHKIWQDPNV